MARRLHSKRQFLTRPKGSPVSAYKCQIQLWAVRILLDLKVYRRIGKGFLIDKDSVCEFLELEQSFSEQLEDRVKPKMLLARKEILEQNPLSTNSPLADNLERLSEALGLSVEERSILEFVLFIHSHGELGEVTDLLGNSMSLGDILHALSITLELPYQEVREALHSSSLLLQSGLLRIERSTGTLRSRLRVFGGFVDTMTSGFLEGNDVLDSLVKMSPPPLLIPDDFRDCLKDYDLARDFLSTAVRDGLEGVNILVYGQPGVGKTQLSRTLAKDLDCELFEIGNEDEDGDPRSPWQRFMLYKLNQQLLAKRGNSILLFDEIEDVFPESDNALIPRSSIADQNKGWVNQTLENNPVPAIWIGNKVLQMDPAYVRRFDLVLELTGPSFRGRKRHLASKCKTAGVHLGSWVNQIAKNEHITPGVVEKVIRVMNTAGVRDSTIAPLTFERLAGNTLRAMGHTAPSLSCSLIELPYAVDLLNTDKDMEAIANGLSKVGEGRLLCYGPPGTGKTAFANYLAERTGFPLMVIGASDILGPYVGMTESNLANVFQKAKNQSAILLLDEIDSLLRSRESAQHSWETTQVNELLVQMEAFKGIMIACTNHREVLDGAASRRFDIKVNFGYLEPDKAWELFQSVLEQNGVRMRKHNFEIKKQLAALHNLTPGDYKTAIRSFMVMGREISPVGLLEALVNESVAKETNVSRGIGFTATL